MDQYYSAFKRAQLIIKYLKNELNEDETNELETWKAASETNHQLFEQLVNENSLREELKFFEKTVPEEGWQKVVARQGNVKKVVSMQVKKRYWWYGTAAAVVFLIGSIVVFRLTDTKNGLTDIAKQVSPKQDVPPGGDKAVLILADGSQIILDSASDGKLSQQGNTKVIKLGGKLAYQPTSGEKGKGEISFNTISTPRGGQYQLELPDGTQVWLNAASSLHFPTAFAGSTRKVEISGEAYFEVATNKKMPFIVRVDGSEIQVLGTHFNIMAYSDEDAVKTTLLEGAVKFVNEKKTSLLKPGQQLQLTKGGQLKVLSNVDVDEVVAWKNGMIQINNSDLHSVIRQLSRWYDIEAVFKPGTIRQDLFVLEMPRNSKLSDVLKVLELTGNIKFKIEGKKIIVFP